MADVTRILADIQNGDEGAAERLLPLVYEELRRLAAQRMAHESPGQTLQATALVHEAYVRLVGDAADQHWNGRGHFFGAAAEAMRRILVERARQKASLQGGGHLDRIALEDAVTLLAEDVPDFDLLDLNEALTEFEREDPHRSEFVKLRFFAGLSHEEAAAALGISTATASRYWTYARAWLYGRISRN